jgi:superfamily I DNA/RNA helicase
LVERFRELRGRLRMMVNIVGPGLVEQLFPAEQDWADPFRTFASTIDEPDYSAEKLRDVLRVAITQPELPTDVDYVRIMSLHKSKGLTADFVVVVGCIEGLLPSIDTTEPMAEQQRIEEEQRRLFYVAITRTRQVLVLSSVTRLPRDLAHRIGARVTSGSATHANTITSRFLTELGPDRPEPTVGLR